jgi:ElaB/YqjD/DUF883 family membrane-anchored ribosome-binding protein
MNRTETNSLKNSDSANNDTALHDKITKMKEDVKTLGASLVNSASGEAKLALEKGEGAAHEAVAKSREALDYVSSELETLEARLTERMRKKPVQTMGLALGAGFVLALLLRK